MSCDYCQREFINIEEVHSMTRIENKKEVIRKFCSDRHLIEFLIVN